MKEMYFDYYYIVYEYNTVYIYVLLSQNNEEILRNAAKCAESFGHGGDLNFLGWDPPPLIVDSPDR